MTNIRMKIATAATILGLGGLGGFAMATNPARDGQGAAAQVAATRTGSATAATNPVVTRTSGAVSPAVPTTTRSTPATRTVVTRTSGAAGAARRTEIERDDGPAVYED